MINNFRVHWFMGLHNVMYSELLSWQQYQYHYKFAMCRSLLLVKALWIMVGLEGSFLSLQMKLLELISGVLVRNAGSDINVVAVQVK